MASTKFSSISFLFMISIATICNAQQTFVFYLQDIATGPSSTVSAVTGIVGKDWTYNQFGTIFAVDDPVMMSPSSFSAQVGRAQGMLMVSAHDATSVSTVLSIVFNNLQYSGSTIEIQGISRQRENYRELSVVSGTGRFRYVRGYAVFETVSYDPVSAHTVIRLTLNLRAS